ncbi:MAG: hypothetical protein DRP46_14210 [Candidatus Zixiibacteriota bacterium]|nr:MAG: hypothetical protein DRP46_14210 [candidate division Zixibacteria bacterium]
MKIDYEILEERVNGSSVTFQILYDIFDDNGKPLKRKAFGFSTSVGRAYDIVDYDDEGKPIPFWKQQIDILIRDTLESYEKSLKPAPKELKPILNKKYSIVSEVSATPTKEDDIRVLAKVKWIGLEMAKGLIDRFGTLQGVLDATKEELISVYGIGKDNIKKIYKSIHTLEKL